MDLNPTTPLFDDLPVEDAPVAPMHADAALVRLGEKLPKGVRLGTSSWNFPGWRGIVYSPSSGSRRMAAEGLAAYAAHPIFRTVGIDRNFYRPLSATEFARFGAQVPDDFSFLVKAPRLVTDPFLRHEGGRVAGVNADFLNPKLAFERFLKPVEQGLGDKTGALVFEISPWPRGALRKAGLVPEVVERIGAFFEALAEKAVVARVLAAEFRNPELLTPRMMRTLKRVGVRPVLGVHPSMPDVRRQISALRCCVPMNDDAHAILADMGDGEDLKGAKLDVAVNAIVGSLVCNGYLESISSAIMISVEDRDQSRAHRLQQDLSAAVDGILRDSASQASVLTQTVTQDTSLEKQAKDHHISTGKAALVNRILALNNSLSFEELSRLSIGELKDLAETGAPAMPIGMERALEIALLTCGQSADQLTKQEVDAELDEVPAHYEVELEDRSGTEYEYRIDAYTGAVLTSYVEPDGHNDADDHDDYDDDHDDDDDDAQPTGSAQPTGQIGHAAAKSAALTHAGVSESQAYDMDVELDDEEGRGVYEVEFKADGMEYEYVIDAYTGAVLEYDMEQDD